MAPLSSPLTRAVEVIRRRGGMVALTGAGASTESGIPDFRGADGLWARYDPLEYGTLAAFQRDPVRVWTMLAELLAVVEARPNPGHLAMARLEEEGWLAGIITQNIDGLHQKAGSRNVVEFHGSLATFSCPACRRGYPLPPVRRRQGPPRCACGAVLKPDIVFFDEVIGQAVLQRTEALLTQAGVLLVAGTSCQVAPAGLIPRQFKLGGGAVIEVNREPVLAGLADVIIPGEFSLVLSRLAEELR